MLRSYLILALLLVMCGPVYGQDFLQTSPGALSKSHASIDGSSNCNECHDGGNATNDRKCLGCHDHKNLKRRIDAGKGYHATPKVKSKKCEVCHSEHKGRGFNIMGWKAVGGMRNFNHNDAGWPLEGRHATTRCEDCHKTKNRQGLRVFLGEDKLCGSCHKKDQPHGFDRRAMLRCERCHTQGVWKPPKRRLEFNHNKKADAAMPLEGSHEDVACVKCHAKAKFNLGRSDPDYCGHCHKSPHKRHLFDKGCDRCHSPRYKSLGKFRFNHSRRTRFSLGSAHGDLDCYTCHTKSLGKSKPKRGCETCHGSENPHKKRFKAFGAPPACGVCHPASNWKTKSLRFDHNRRTKFKLEAKHATATCRECHRGKNPASFERFNPRTVGCMGCHKHKNAHNREYKDNQCLKCHKTPGQVRLKEPEKMPAYQQAHGGRGTFPLVAGHRKAECRDCHTDPKTGKTSYRDTPNECGTCHQDSLHKGSLGTLCSKCHAPGEWGAPRFDHDNDDHADYKLVGLHRSVPKCEDCHQKRQFSGTPTSCGAVGCHKNDDAHRGKLGNDCARCHVETGEITFDHNTMSRFALDGKHLGVSCSGCHKNISFKPLATNCFACHAEPKIHKGKYGTRCESCHTTASFSNIRPLHDVGAFALRGQHDQIACARCHKNNRALQGTGNLCITCHRQDDIHNNGLSPRCGECHTQFSFAPARFDHTTVGCNLSGLHRTLPCYDCHRAGNFVGLSPQCASCHQVDAQARAGHGTQYTTCSTCHNPNQWLPAGAGVGGSNRESLCR